MIEFLGNRETIESRQEIEDLQRVIHEAAQETKAIELPRYAPMPTREIAESLMEISNATEPLSSLDRARFVTADGTTEINTGFRVTPERIEEVLTLQTIIAERPMILKVKKPDFLGDSMWDFRFEGRKISAKVVDQNWISEFHKRNVSLHPGDCLHATVEETVKYGADGEVIAIHYRVIQVGGVLRTNETSR